MIDLGHLVAFTSQGGVWARRSVAQLSGAGLIFFAQLFMDRQIFHAEVANILSDRHDKLSVDVRMNPVEDERKMLVRLTLDTNDEYMPGTWAISDFCPDNARALALFLWDAADCAALMDETPRAGIIGVRKLPTITLCGTELIVDERMRQLRNVNNPAHFFDLEDRMSK